MTIIEDKDDFTEGEQEDLEALSQGKFPLKIPLGDELPDDLKGQGLRGATISERRPPTHSDFISEPYVYKSPGDIFMQYLRAPDEPNCMSTSDIIVAGAGIDWLTNGRIAYGIRKLTNHIEQLLFDEKDTDPAVLDFIARLPSEEQENFYWMRDVGDLEAYKSVQDFEENRYNLERNMGVYGHIAKIASPFLNPINLYTGNKILNTTSRLISGIVGSRIAENFMVNVIERASKGSLLSKTVVELATNGSTANAALTGGIIGTTFAITSHKGREFVDVPVGDMGSDLITGALFGAALGGSFGFISNNHDRIRKLGISEFKDLVNGNKRSWENAKHFDDPRYIVAKVSKYQTKGGGNETASLIASLANEKREDASIFHYAESDHKPKKSIKYAKKIPVVMGVESNSPTIRNVLPNAFINQFVDVAHPNVSTTIEHEVRNVFRGMAIEAGLRLDKQAELFKRGGFGDTKQFDIALTRALHSERTISNLNPHVGEAVRVVDEFYRKSSHREMEHGIHEYSMHPNETFIHASSILKPGGLDLDETAARVMLTKMNPNDSYKDITNKIKHIKNYMFGPLTKGEHQELAGRAKNIGHVISTLDKKITSMNDAKDIFAAKKEASSEIYKLGKNLNIRSIVNHIRNEAIDTLRNEQKLKKYSAKEQKIINKFARNTKVSKSKAEELIEHEKNLIWLDKMQAEYHPDDWLGGLEVTEEAAESVKSLINHLDYLDKKLGFEIGDGSEYKTAEAITARIEEIKEKINKKIDAISTAEHEAIDAATLDKNTIFVMFKDKEMEAVAYKLMGSENREAVSNLVKYGKLKKSIEKFETKSLEAKRNLKDIERQLEEQAKYTEERFRNTKIFKTAKMPGVPIIYNDLEGVTPQEFMGLTAANLTERQAKNILSQVKEHVSYGYKDHIPHVKSASNYHAIIHDREKILNDIFGARQTYVDGMIKENPGLTEDKAIGYFNDFVGNLQINAVANNETIYWARKASSAKRRVLDIDPVDLVPDEYIVTDVKRVLNKYAAEMGWEIASRRVFKALGYKSGKIEQVIAAREAEAAGIIDKDLKEDLRALKDLRSIIIYGHGEGQSSSSWLDKAIDSFHQLNMMRCLGKLPLTLIEDEALTAHTKGTFTHIAEIAGEFAENNIRGMSREEMMSFGVAIDEVTNNNRMLTSNEPLKGLLNNITSKFYKATGMAKLEDAKNATLYRTAAWELSNAIKNGELRPGVNTRLTNESINEIKFMLDRHGLNMDDWEHFNVNIKEWSYDAQRDFTSDLFTMLMQKSPRPTAGSTPYFLNDRFTKLFSVFQSYNSALTTHVLLPLFRDGKYGSLVNLVVRGMGYAMITNIIRGYISNDPYDTRDPEFYRQSFLRSPLGLLEHPLNIISSTVVKGVQGDLKVIPIRELPYELFASGSTKYLFDIMDAMRIAAKAPFSDEPITEQEIMRIKAIAPFNNLFYIEPILNHWAIPAIMEKTGGKRKKTKKERYKEKVGE